MMLSLTLFFNGVTVGLFLAQIIHNRNHKKTMAILRENAEMIKKICGG